MHYFSGKGCSESLESMHYCIGILTESHQENRIYNHRLYEIKIQVFPEDEQKENFVVNGRHYYWMSISDMERDPNIVKKNLDVIDFVKESMHA